jgi:GT2 family glycosyltransferase
MNNSDTPPHISVIIVTWNSSAHLARCLDCLTAQTINNFEIIIVDNGSTDGTIDRLEGRWPRLTLRIEHNDSNLGFAVANNIGARLARGQWLALLNADAFPEPNWLEQLIFAGQKNPEFTFFSSRQVQFKHPELLDGAGDEYHVSGLAWRRYYDHRENEYGVKLEEVFSACAAAALYLREDFLKVDGFDEDYFSYFEDVDLSFRLRLAGGRCLYVPDAVIHHVGSASTGKMSDFAIYHGHRNLVWTYFKNMPSLLFWVYLPLHVLMNIYFVFSFSFKGKMNTIVSAKIDAIRDLRSILNKRRMIQKSRVVSMSNIYRIMSKGLFSPYWASRQRKLLASKKT